MDMKDGFPLIRSDHAERAEQLDSGSAWHRAVMSPGFLKACLVSGTAAMAVLAGVAVGSPPGLFATVTDFVGGLSTPRTGSGDNMPIGQPTAEARALPPVASEVATHDEAAAAPLKTAEQSPSDVLQAPAGHLLDQFQAWAAGKTTEAEDRPVQPAQDPHADPAQDAHADPVQDEAHTDPVQDLQTGSVQDARAEIRPVQEHRAVGPVKNAKAEIRAKQNHLTQNHLTQNQLAKIRREKEAREQARRVQDAHAQEPAAPPVPPAQHPQGPTFLESLGFHD
ncbi:hypothetical protein [Bradyrhizobium sp.]|uniref:hypothetical protein n=1 Tax=Bradyrhizobium sp. TaxID=376 RepID=UPI003C3BCFB5